jgi:murein DD-endopeptidase MepM/ murein hydrolase activator NlpD
VHDGIDFKAELGTSIKAVADGKIKKIYTDDLLGNVIVADHSGGIEVYYCGVSENYLVKEGQEITLGENIGTVGTVPSELLEEPHLHLMVKVNEKFVDPLLAMGKG